MFFATPDFIWDSSSTLCESLALHKLRYELSRLSGGRLCSRVTLVSRCRVGLGVTSRTKNISSQKPKAAVEAFAQAEAARYRIQRQAHLRADPPPTPTRTHPHPPRPHPHTQTHIHTLARTPFHGTPEGAGQPSTRLLEPAGK